jgi:hypothetical protein
VKRNLEQDELVEDVDDIVTGQDQKRIRLDEMQNENSGVVDESHIVVTGMQVKKTLDPSYQQLYDFENLMAQFQ